MGMGKPGTPTAPQAAALDRRAFVAGMAATVAAVACSSGDDGGAEGAGADSTATTVAQTDLRPLPGDLPPEDVPAKETIYGWIEEVFGHGVRRPGYEADIWAEEWVAERFRELGLENVRAEPVPLTRWEPIEWSLVATPDGGEPRQLECFPLPYSAPIRNLEVELAAWDDADSGAVEGKASLVENALLSLPVTFMSTASSSTPITGDPADRIVDAEGTFEGEQHLTPFSTQLQEVMEPSIEAGARAFVGWLKDYPGNSYKYFVPYDGIEREIPGVWISGSDGEWLQEQLAAGPVTITLNVDSTLEEFESNNIVGELPGADDEMVIVGSHHDGPWASAVEDSSGISLVLAQATFWAAQPQERRPHRMVFLLNGGHMCGGAGIHKFIDDHADELDQVVLQVHLEHAALDFEDRDGELVSTGRNTPRWFFTSRIPQLEDTVRSALVDEELNRSMLCAPDAISPNPPTDGAFFHENGVPLVHFLEAPFYLFDEMDTLDKIDQDNLVPLARATIRVIESTRGVSAADMRAGATS